MNYLNEKYIAKDFNTNYLIKFLKNNDFLNLNREELRFRISELTHLQALKVLNEVILAMSSESFEFDEMKLTRENLEMFFEFIDFGDFPFPCISQMNFKGKSKFWMDFLNKGQRTKKDDSIIFSFQNEYNNESNKLINQLIGTLKFKLEFSHKKVLDYFSNAVYGPPENFQAEVGSIAIIDYIIRYLEYIQYFEQSPPFLFYPIDNDTNYQVNTEDMVLLNLYNQLELNEFIDINKTTYKDFLNVFKKNWYSHKSILYLEMDNIQTKFLFDKIKEFLSINISFSSIEKAKNIKNKNGFIKANNIYSSASKSYSLPKESESIINSIKKVKV